MRVLQLGPFPPPWGGVQTNVVSIRDFVRRSGGECSVINITRHRKLDADGVYYPESAAGVMRLLVSLDYDVVHVHVGGGLPRRVLALLLACTAVPGRSSVFTFHSGGYPASPEGQAAKARSLLGFVLRRFDAVVGVNAQLVELFGRLGVAPDRNHMIAPHSFSRESLNVAMRGRGALPPSLHDFYTAHDQILISVGLLEPEYDLELQLRGFERIAARWPRTGLVLVGSGSLESELRARIASMPYGDRVLLCGDQPREAALLAIAEASILLRTTRYDGDAISGREARQLGVPVIATDNGMRPEGVELIPIGDCDALVKMVSSIFETASMTARTPAAPDESNLQRVLDVYRRTLAVRS